MKQILTIHVPNASVMALYDMEMEGQISDGKYENSRPYDHYKWLSYVKDIVVDDKIGISSDVPYNPRYSFAYGKKYNINEWITYINGSRKGIEKYKDYDWAVRAIAFAKFGRIYPNMDYTTLRSLGEVRIFLEDLQMKVEDEETNPETLFNQLTNFEENDWRKKYYEQCKEYFTLDFVKKYMELEYDVKELKEDLKLLSDCVNTVL